MQRRDFLTKTTIAAAGLCALPLMAQTDLSLDIWEDTERALRHDLLSDTFPHAYHHRGCGHVVFYSDHKFEVGEVLWPNNVRLPDGRKPRIGEGHDCPGCGEAYWPHSGDLYDLYIGSPDED